MNEEDYEEDLLEDLTRLEMERNVINQCILGGEFTKGSICDNSRPNIWVLINIPIRDDTQLDKLFEAQRLLREAGVSFDSGFGGCGRDWCFDWSLVGAKVFLCSTQPGQNPRLDEAAIQAQKRRDGNPNNQPNNKSDNKTG